MPEYSPAEMWDRTWKGEAPSSRHQEPARTEPRPRHRPRALTRRWCTESRNAGRSAAWLARLPWEQEVTSSNLVAPIAVALGGSRPMCFRA
jgi:hypothetical protein